MPPSRQIMQHMLLWLAIFVPILIGIPETLSAQVSDQNSTAVPPQAPAFLILSEIVQSYEDGQFLELIPALDREITNLPNNLALRYLRQSALAQHDPVRFLAETRADSVDDLASADRYEYWVNTVLRFDLERMLYRGDRGGEAGAFIARVEQLAEDADQGISRLTEANPENGWVLFPKLLLQHYRQKTDVVLALDIWTLSVGNDPWAIYLRLLLLQYDLVPTAERVTYPETLQYALPSGLEFLRGKLILLTVQHSVKKVSQEDAIAQWRQVVERFPPGVFKDDVELALGTELAGAYSQELREEATVWLTPLIEPPFRNTTYDAASQLGAVLRRLKRYERAIELYEQFHLKYVSEWQRFDRPMGRAFYHLERFPEAVAAFRRSAEGPRGSADDYLYIAEAMRLLPQTQASSTQTPGAREDALKLTDFSSAAKAEEIRVWGWNSGIPPAISEMARRWSELVVLSRHALLFPRVYMTLGLRLFVELIVLALGLVVFVSFPRLTKQVWKSSLAVTGLVVGMTGVALATSMHFPESPAVSLAWLCQTGVRLYFVMTGTLILSAVVGLPGLGVLRGCQRAWRRRRLSELLAIFLPVVACAGALMAVEFLVGAGWRVPTNYLERLPRLILVGELGGTTAQTAVPADIALYLIQTLQRVVVTVGFVLTLSLYLLGRPWRNSSWIQELGIVAGVAIGWSVISIGTMEPAGRHFFMTLFQCFLLGTLSLRRGLDGAVLAQISAIVGVYVAMH